MLAFLFTGSAGFPLTLAAQEIPERDFAKPTASVKDLENVNTVRELANGAVLFYNRNEQKLMVTDFSAKPRTVMSAGALEHEFQVVGPLWQWNGDTIVSLDILKGRLMAFGVDGGFVGIVGPSLNLRGASGAPGGARGGQRLPDLRFLAGNALVGTITPPRPPAVSATEIPSRIPEPLVRVSLAPFRMDTLAMLMPAQQPRPPFVVREPLSMQVYVGTDPLQPIDVYAVLNDGTVAVLRAATYRIDYFNADGTRSQTAPIPFTRINVTENDQKRVMNETKAFTQRATVKSRAALRFDEPKVWPAVHPPFRHDIAVRVDGADRLWVPTRCALDEQSTCYDVITRDGTRVERVRFAGAAAVMGFGKDAVYTVAPQKDKSLLQRHPLH